MRCQPCSFRGLASTYRFESLLEKIHVQLLEFCSSKLLGEVFALVEALDFDAGGHLAGQCSLGFLNLTLELAHGLEILGDIDAFLLVVALREVVDNPLV